MPSAEQAARRRFLQRHREEAVKLNKLNRDISPELAQHLVDVGIITSFKMQNPRVYQGMKYNCRVHVTRDQWAKLNEFVRIQRRMKRA